ncbi:hypothetical protein O3P69_013612 [Scylla paramamosain]|uniref:Uncharacterized protein n=1 Tax=Scylla paramamosain TaxID=85552 RepID=A0AAW0SQM7_SCYPA
MFASLWLADLRVTRTPARSRQESVVEIMSTSSQLYVAETAMGLRAPRSFVWTGVTHLFSPVAAEVP